jgi:predicted O-methyltransferase YrrM
MLSHEADLDVLNRLHPEPAALLLEIEKPGRYDEVPVVERATGRLLSTLVHAMQANRILEIGTAYGYSTLWMALAMPPAGHIWTIDPDRERTTLALEYIERAGKKPGVDVINQPALEILNASTLRNLDIIFIDADLALYSQYLQLCVPMLKLSGLLILDDLFNPAAEAFNRHFLSHPNLDATIVPVGKGVGIGARIA